MTEIVVTQADKDLLKSLFDIADDSETSWRINKGLSYTVEVEEIAAHRIAALEEAAKVADQTDTGWMDARTFTAQKIAAAIRALKGPANG